MPGMKRRWIIRLCFILPIVLCLLAWAWSTQHSTEITYSRPAKNTAATCGLLWGEIYVRRVDGLSIGGEGWSVSDYAAPFHFMHTYLIGPSATSFLGFSYERGRHATGSAEERLLCVPIWFPILVFSALLIPVWRKTRPARAARSFPVEASEKSPGDNPA